MKKINLPQKGEPDYLIRQKKLSTIKTAISFAAAIIIFIIGYAIYHTRENIFTIIAVLAGKQKYGVHDHVFKDTGL